MAGVGVDAAMFAEQLPERPQTNALDFHNNFPRQHSSTQAILRMKAIIAFWSQQAPRVRGFD
jgi:hypothetical protein